MRNLRRALYGLAALGLVGMVVGLSPGHNQPLPSGRKPASATPAAGKSSATLTRYSMKLAANGLQVSVYPKDALHPFDSPDWFVEVPVTVTAVQYDKDRQELLATVDYNWRKSDEDTLRAQLAWKYKAAGKPVPPEAITITPLEVAGYSLHVRDMDKEYTLFKTTEPTKLTAQTVAFRVPMMAGADRLHARLSTTPEAVQLVLRAGYRFDRIAGLTIERKALNTAWENVLEKVFPNKENAKAGPLLVDRNAEQELRRLLAAELATVIKSYGLSPAEEADAVERALAHIEKLALPSAPMTVKELLELGSEGSLAVTAKGLQVEAKPAMSEEDLTRLKETRSRSEKVTEVAKKISDIAKNSAIDDRKFHSLARKLVLDAGGSAGFLCFSAKANMHLDKNEGDITDNHLKDIKQARTYTMNEAAYTQDVQAYYSREVEGPRIQKSESLAKLLKLRRVSAATLAAVASQDWSWTRVTGSDVLVKVTPVALKPTPIPVEDDVVAKMLKEMRAVKADVVAWKADVVAWKGQQEKTNERTAGRLQSLSRRALFVASSHGNEMVTEGAGQPLKFGTQDIANENWDGQTFTAPYAGKYLFAWSFTRKEAGNDTNCWIRCNGVELAAASAPNSGGREYGSAVTILQLEEGDKVDLFARMQGGARYTIRDHRFLGVLLPE